MESFLIKTSLKTYPDYHSPKISVKEATENMRIYTIARKRNKTKKGVVNRQQGDSLTHSLSDLRSSRITT
ncbi:CLUMA_CG007734, isoform A [Clunio marinus]|uniref:CLUMA_CG007734, isoform A n=1 Tax=Clunio marinus TaxID=568069 RepID=A0A1J1I1Y3_9DIPT|nr:CLUMA_CG007734, isoform A [Clunio marinus]